MVGLPKLRNNEGTFSFCTGKLEIRPPITHYADVNVMLNLRNQLLAVLIVSVTVSLQVRLYASSGFYNCGWEPCSNDCRANRRCSLCESGPKTLFNWNFCGCKSTQANSHRNEPLVTDRPDFTEASSTVGRGRIQLEMGYTYTYDTQDGSQVVSHSYPEPLFRIGLLAEWLELRVAWNYLNERTTSRSESTNLSGSEDLYLGFKIALTEQCGILPEMAIMPQMTVPTAGSAFTENETLPGINWLYSWELSENVALGGSTQGNQAIDDSGADFLELAQSLTVGVGLTEQLGSYFEWYAFFPHSAEVALPEHYLNGGFTWLAHDNLQYDVRVGAGLNDNADDYFLGTGMSLRY